MYEKSKAKRKVAISLLLLVIVINFYSILASADTIMKNVPTQLPTSSAQSSAVNLNTTTTNTTVSNTDEKASILERPFSAMIRGFGKAIDYGLFRNTDGKPSSVSIDNLVFNANTKNGGLTLFSKTPLRTYILKLYTFMQYLAACVFIPMGLLIIYYITRAGDNAQRYSEMKDKATRWFGTIILLVMMPQLLDFLFILCDGLVNVFKAFGTQYMTQAGTGAIKTSQGEKLLLQTFREIAKNDKTVASAVIYCMSVFLNAWLIIFYIIRDIAVTYLFAIFPIIAIWMPFKKGMVSGWAREMIGNMVTQPIQAFMFSVLLASATVIDQSTMYGKLFILVSFAAFIPMTAVFKRLVGLQGSVGAASSMAGVGALFGAISLGKGAFKSVKQGTSNFKEGAKEYASAKTQERLMNKNAFSSESVSGDLNQLHALQSPTSMESIKNQKREAVGKMMKGASTVSAGSLVGGLSAIGSSVYGIKGVALGSSIGTIAGAKIGGAAGGGLGVGYKAVSHYGERSEQFRNSENSEQENKDEYTGLTNPMLQNTEYKNQEQKAILAKKSLQALGFGGVIADFAYAKKTPNRASEKELSGVSNALLHNGEKQSVIYTQNQDGSRNILWTGGSNSELPLNSEFNVSFAEGTNEVGQNRLKEIKEEDKATQSDSLSKEKKINQSMRKMTNLPNIVATSKSRPYNDKIVPITEVEAIMNKPIESLSEINAINLANNIGESEMGYALTTKTGKMIFNYDRSTGQTIPVAIAEGNHALGTNSMEYSAVRFQDGKILEDEIKYALNGVEFEKLPSEQVQPFDTSKLSPEIIQSIPANNDIVVTVNVEGSEPQYHLLNNSTGEYIGTEPIPFAHAENEMQSYTYHIVKDAGGNINQHYHGSVTDRDVSRLYFAEYQKQISEINSAKENLSRIQIEKEEIMKQMLDYQAINSIGSLDLNDLDDIRDRGKFNFSESASL